MRILYLALLSLALMLPVQASDVSGAFLKYLTNKYPGKVVGVSGNDASCRIDYTNDASKDDIAAIEREKQNFSFVALPDPDVKGFKRALNADPNIPDLAKVQLTPYLILIDSYTTDPDGTKAAWTRVKKVLNLDPTIAAGIEQYAAAYGMPLN